QRRCRRRYRGWRIVRATGAFQPSWRVSFLVRWIHSSTAAKPPATATATAAWRRERDYRPRARTCGL
ncbi:hypothetical protein GGI11_009233, partial [Coemansia sp. RSA 2049]